MASQNCLIEMMSIRTQSDLYPYAHIPIYIYLHEHTPIHMNMHTSSSYMCTLNRKHTF